MFSRIPRGWRIIDDGVGLAPVHCELFMGQFWLDDGPPIVTGELDKTIDALEKGYAAVELCDQLLIGGGG